MEAYRELYQEIQSLKIEIAKLKNTVEQLQRDNTVLGQENATLKEENTSLKQEVAALNEKLNTNSTNSSIPPSQDQNREKKKRKKTGKKAGGQPGHCGHKRKMFPPEEVDRQVDLYPDACPHCGSTGTFDPDPIKTHIHQQIELPEIKPDITQYNIHTCRCGKCNQSVTAESPPEGKKGFGLRVARGNSRIWH